MKICFVFLMLSLAPVSVEASRFTICNQSNSDILQVTMLYQNHLWAPLGESWKVYGWMDVMPGRCQPLVEHPGRLETFLAVLRKKGSRRSSSVDFPIDTRDGRVKKAKRYFCVRDEPFDRTLQRLDAHESCPVSWYAQLFNVYIEVEMNVDYTLRLGK